MLLNVIESTISGNSGDGIDNVRGTLNVVRSTISNNTDDATFSGNGIKTDGVSTFGRLTVTNSTISGNEDQGIQVLGGTLSVANSTISDNTAGILIFTSVPSAVNVKSTIIASNELDVLGESHQAGLFIGKIDGSTGFTQPTDQTEQSFALDPKLDSSGYKTMVANPNDRSATASPAMIKASLPTHLAAKYDQRGAVYTIFDDPAIAPATGATKDIGAFELNLQLDSTPTRLQHNYNSNSNATRLQLRPRLNSTPTQHQSTPTPQRSVDSAVYAVEKTAPR